MLVEVKPAKMDEEDGLKEEKWVPMTLREHPRVIPFPGLGVKGIAKMSSERGLGEKRELD